MGCQVKKAVVKPSFTAERCSGGGGGGTSGQAARGRAVFVELVKFDYRLGLRDGDLHDSLDLCKPQPRDTKVVEGPRRILIGLGI
jgi:hypothetical protein